MSEILLVSPYFYPHVGGVESHVRYLARNLSKRGLNVTVVTTLIGGLKEDEDFEGYHIHRIKPLMTLLRTPITPGIKGYIRKRAENKSEKIVVHAHSPPPLPAYYAARATGDLVLTYHCDEDLPTPVGSLIVWLYRSTFGRYTVKKAKRVIASTASYAKTSRLLWNRRVDIVPMAVDTNFFKPVDPSQLRNELVSKGVIEGRDRVVLFVGRLVQHKGLEEIISSAEYVDAKFFICGDGPLKNRLEKDIETGGLKDKVKLLGSIEDELLPYYYSLCDVFVLPSHSRLEAFGIVLLEAMACGKPIIASDIPGSREIVVEGYNGLLAEPLNAMDLAEKINTILQNEKNAKEMGKNGRRLAEERYSWDRVTDEIIRTYSETFGELQ